MSDILDIEVGYVTNRRGARLHLVGIDGGRSYCKSGSGVIIQSRKVNDGDAPHVCKKCREALRTRLANVRSVRYRRSCPGADLYGVAGNLKMINACDELIEAIMTPAERVARDATLDKLRRSWSTSRAVPINPMTSFPESDDQLTLI